MISSGVVIFTIAATQFNYVWGQVIGFLSLSICLYWGMAYRRLDR